MKSQSIKELVIYTDRECGGLECGRIDSGGKACYINNVQVSRSKYLSTDQSMKVLSAIGYNRDTTFLKVYDLKGTPISQYYIVKGYFPDTIGLYLEYYPNGNLRTKGKYVEIDIAKLKKNNPTADLPMPQTVRHGIWEFYNVNGILRNRILYNMGTVRLQY